MKSFVIATKNGEAMPTNDENDAPLICDSKAHALRVIQWLGLPAAKVRAATEEEVAAGKFCAVHSTPS